MYAFGLIIYFFIHIPSHPTNVLLFMSSLSSVYVRVCLCTCSGIYKRVFVVTTIETGHLMSATKHATHTEMDRFLLTQTNTPSTHAPHKKRHSHAVHSHKYEFCPTRDIMNGACRMHSKDARACDASTNPLGVSFLFMHQLRTALCTTPRRVLRASSSPSARRVRLFADARIENVLFDSIID